MIRTLTGGWIPFGTWTERGSLRHCLRSPEVLNPELQMPTNDDATSMNSRCLDRIVSRRAVLNYGVAGAAALGVTAWSPRPASAGFFGFLAGLAIKFVVPVIKWFVVEVIKTVAEVAIERAIDSFLARSDDDFAAHMKVAERTLQTGEGAKTHEKYSDGIWYPKELKVATARSKDFGTDIGLDLIQWKINNNVLEQDAMRNRKIPCASPTFRKERFANVLAADFRDANFRYVDPKKGDSPFRESHVKYTVPLLSRQGKQYTGFCVQRPTDELPNFLIVKSND